MKKLLTITIMALLLMGCGSQNQIKIGNIAALTGYGAEWGTDENRAIELAIEEINAQGGVDGKRLKLISEDSQTDNQAAITAFTKLTEVDDIKFIIGTTWEAGTTAIVPLAAQQDVVLITPSSYKGVQDQNSDNLFSTYPPYGYEVQNLQSYFEENNLKNFIIIHHTEFFSEIMKDIFIQEADKNEWIVKEILAQDLEERDFRTILLRIKNIQNIDAIYAPLESNHV